MLRERASPRPLASMLRHTIEITFQSFSNNLAHAQGRSRGCVHLVTVMHLHDLDVGRVSDHLGGKADETQREIHADAEVRRRDDRCRCRRRSKRRLVVFTQPRCAHHQCGTSAGTEFSVATRPFRQS